MTLSSGRYLKAARVLAGLTQRQLAGAAGLHPNSVKYWEQDSSFICGYAVDRMVEALDRHGVSCGGGHVRERLRQGLSLLVVKLGVGGEW